MPEQLVSSQQHAACRPIKHKKNLLRPICIARLRRGRSVVGARTVTGVGLHDDARVGEVAVPGVAAVGGVVEVHGDGGVREQVVGVVARPARLDHGAAYVGARVVDVGRQDLLVRRRLRHAPRFLCLGQPDGAS